ncbi:type IV pilus modification PilV family protein [Fibrobacter sp. UBA4309]|uniref:type IV pilus modification PilV family protein n=1 Tax=Fibrobacter sp. UBA4309 TaxID=1946537 RepID=UPI0025B81412|nr:hypothetical protein [Fibrobacter sp. UBA4309]
MNRSSVAGFTLPEVCVAMVTLFLGLLALGYFVESFAKLRALEKDRVESFVEAVGSMERKIADPPPCTDSLLSQPLLARRKLVYVTEENEHVRLRRLVRCR